MVSVQQESGKELTETQKQHILVVDDNADNAHTLTTYLEHVGYEAMTIADGQQALDLVRLRDFDLILLGLNIPTVSGIEVLRRLKSDPSSHDIPVIMISSVQNVERISECLEAGAEDYVREPFSPALLKARVGLVLEKKRIQDDLKTHLRDVESVADNLKNVVLPLGIALSAEKDFDRLLERILLEAKRVCNADAGTLYRRTQDNHLRFSIMVTDSLGIAMGGTTGKEIPLPALRMYNEKTAEPNYRNVASYVALHRQTVNIPDIYHAHEFDFSGTMEFDKRNNYRSVSGLTLPIIGAENEVVAVLQLLNAEDQETGQVVAFSSHQQLVVEALASLTAIALNNQLLMQRQTELLKFEHDLQIGRQIQASFLPGELPQLEGWDIAAAFYPAREVAGDFYDVFALARNRIAFVIADVCDKGVGAALFMALTRSLLRSFSHQHHNMDFTDILTEGPVSHDKAEKARQALQSISISTLKNTVTLTNDYIATNHGQLNMFATLFFGVLDPENGFVSYVNGGHNPPAILDAHGVIKERLKPTGPAVGMLPNSVFEIRQTHLDPGDVLFLFTDGVTDARNPQGKLVTEKGLLAILEQGAESATELVNRLGTILRDHIGEAAQFDDITMLAIQRFPEETK